MVSQVAFASHAYLRSARALLPKLSEPRSQSPPLPCERPSLSHRAGIPQPPRPRLLPTPDGLHFIYFRRTDPGRPDGSSGRSQVKNQKR
eukprot:6180214-Pleurochrysis_carterae.AAC.3